MGGRGVSDRIRETARAVRYGEAKVERRSVLCVSAMERWSFFSFEIYREHVVARTTAPERILLEVGRD